MIVDGRGIAERAYERLEGELARAGRTLVLGLLAAGYDPVTESFIRIKARAAARLRVAIDRLDLPAGAGTAEAVAAVHDLAGRCDGVVVQLPLPASIDTDAVLAAIPAASDVDALNTEAKAAERRVMAPVARTVLAILAEGGIDAMGKRAVVVGEGRLVGAPCAAALRAAGASVEAVTLERGSLAALGGADIVVSGAGSPGLIEPHMLKPGCALIDAGTSESGGKVVGDADPRCAAVAGLFTPVPGGVGPVAVAMLFANLADLATKAG